MARKWKFIPLALTFSTTSRALVARTGNVIFLSYWPSPQVKQSALLCVSLVTMNRARIHFCPTLLTFYTITSPQNNLGTSNFVTLSFVRVHNLLTKKARPNECLFEESKEIPSSNLLIWIRILNHCKNDDSHVPKPPYRIA